MANPLAHSVSVTCETPPEFPNSAALCGHMVSGLRDLAAADMVVSEYVTGQRYDIEVQLDVMQVAATHLVARLHWQTGDQTHTGPTLRFNVMDTTLAAMSLKPLVRGLLSATPDLRAALAA